ncbi:MAG: hypothetical protein OEY09_12915 [Gammaproteobacteria bacterium]|nr:hypothetical protein [Gammaproteobacteria bacterium]
MPELEPGLFASPGYCGVGLPRGSISGKLLAEYAMEADSKLIRNVQSVSAPNRLPLEPPDRVVIPVSPCY